MVIGMHAVIAKDPVSRFGLNGFSPGDAFLMNHQRVCGQHLTNMVAREPVFATGELFAFSMARAPWVDAEAEQMGFISDNVLYPDASLGDLRAQLAAWRTGPRVGEMP